MKAGPLMTILAMTVGISFMWIWIPLGVFTYITSMFTALPPQGAVTAPPLPSPINPILTPSAQVKSPNPDASSAKPTFNQPMIQPTQPTNQPTNQPKPQVKPHGNPAPPTISLLPSPINPSLTQSARVNSPNLDASSAKTTFNQPKPQVVVEQHRNPAPPTVPRSPISPTDSSDSDQIPFSMYARSEVFVKVLDDNEWKIYSIGTMIRKTKDTVFILTLENARFPNAKLGIGAEEIDNKNRVVNVINQQKVENLFLLLEVATGEISTFEKSGLMPVFTEVFDKNNSPIFKDTAKVVSVCGEDNHEIILKKNVDVMTTEDYYRFDYTPKPTDVKISFGKALFADEAKKLIGLFESKSDDGTLNFRRIEKTMMPILPEAI